MIGLTDESYDMPKEVGTGSAFCIVDEQICYQVDESTVIYKENPIELNVQQNLSFLEPFEEGIIASGDKGTEIISEAGQVVSDLVKGVTCVFGRYAGTLQGEVYEYTDSFALLETLDSRIVQIIEHNEQLVVSTLTKLVLNKEKEIGTKLRKNTNHGGCFYNDKILVCRPNLKIFVYDIKQEQIDKTIALKESCPECEITFGESVEPDLGTLYEVKDNVLLSLEEKEAILIDIEQPCVLQHIALPENCVFEQKLILFAKDNKIHVLSFEEPANQSAEKSVDLPAPDAILPSPSKEDKPSPEPKQEPEQTQPFPPQIINNPTQKTLVYENFTLFPVSKKVEPQRLEYSPHFVFHKYTAPQNEQPLNSFFPFLEQESFSEGSISELAYSLAQDYQLMSSTPQIAGIELNKLNLLTYKQIDSLTIKKLQRFCKKDVCRANELLSQVNKSDPLYPHVKQMLSSLVSKSVFTFAFCRDFISTQPIQCTRIDDLYDVVLPPIDLGEFINQEISNFGDLLSTYPKAFLALAYRMPNLLDGETPDKLSEEEYEFVSLLQSSTQDIRAMKLSREQAVAYCRGETENQVTALIYNYYMKCKRIFGDFIDNFIQVFMLQQIQDLEEWEKHLFLSVFYSFIDVKVQVIEKCKLALFLKQDIVISQNIVNELIFNCNKNFDDDMKQFLDKSIMNRTANVILLELLEQTKQLSIFAQYFAERGQIDATMGLKIDEELQFIIFSKLLEKADPHEVITKYLDIIDKRNLIEYIQETVGWIDREFLFRILREKQLLSVQVMNIISGAK